MLHKQRTFWEMCVKSTATELNRKVMNQQVGGKDIMLLYLEKKE